MAELAMLADRYRTA